MRREASSRRIALGGVFGALSLDTLLMGTAFPAATFVAPAIAGLAIVPVAVEYGIRSGAAVYGAVALLALFVVPDKEMSMFFIFLLGHYPLAKVFLERIRNKALRLAAKLAVFNVSVFIVYGLLLVLFPVAALVEEFADTGNAFLGILLIVGNITFLIYDMAVKRLVAYYCAALRPRLFRQR